MAKRTIEVQKEIDKKPVTGRFVYDEVPGGTLTFPYRKYPKDPIVKWTFVDGEVYTVPRGIATHLQREGKYKVHVHTLDEKGMPSMKIGRMVNRFNFEAISFLDEEDGDTPALYTAETVPMKHRTAIKK